MISLYRIPGITVKDTIVTGEDKTLEGTIN